jgi:copper transport outer membrane protein MctB
VFDLRYHVASLAAVFFALIIGILVGVALASHGLGEGERDRLQEDLRRAVNRGDELQAQLDARVDSNASDRAFVDKTYNLLMDDRLKGMRIAVLYIGSVDTDVQSAITSTLTDAGGAQLRLRVLTVPINEQALAKRLNGRPFLEAYAGEGQLDDLGEALGQEFAAGAETPLWNALETVIVERREGPLKRPADGVIVVRTVPAQTGQTANFLKGLYRGIRDVGVPAVGVELSGSDGSAAEAFKKADLSTVDHLDTPVGRLTLAILLSAAATGNFGTKDPPSDDGLLPNVPPVTTTTTTGG